MAGVNSPPYVPARDLCSSSPWMRCGDLVMEALVAALSGPPASRARAAKSLPLQRSVIAPARLGQVLSQLMVSPRLPEVCGALEAVAEMLSAGDGDGEMWATRFAPLLRQVLPASSDDIVERASRVIGQIARFGGSLAAEHMAGWITTTSSWLQQPAALQAGSIPKEPQPNLRAACLVLAELAENAPMPLVYVHLRQVFDNLWVAVFDGRVSVREAAARALRAWLRVVAHREQPTSVSWCMLAYDECMSAMHSSSADRAHGALLALAELLKAGPDVLDAARLCLAADAAWFLNDSRDRHIQTALLALLPLLASAPPPGREGTWVQDILIHLMAALHLGGEQREAAFASIGLFSLTYGARLENHLQEVLGTCRDALVVAPSKAFGRLVSRPSCTEALQCIAHLSRAFGTRLEAQLSALVPSMASIGLSVALTDALVEVGRCVPSLRPLVRSQLLEAISLELTRRSYDEWMLAEDTLPASSCRTENSIKSMAGASVGERLGVAALTSKAAEAGGGAGRSVSLALRTLGSLPMEGAVNVHPLLAIAAFFDNPLPEVRESAAVSCCRLLEASAWLQTASASFFDLSQVGMLARDPDIAQSESLHAEVLEGLLRVAVADEEASIRLAVLKALTPAFDARLAQVEALELLLMALHDDVVQVRESAIRVLGRVGIINPAYVTAALRTVLIELLAELEHSSAPGAKENAARLLGVVVYASPQLIRPFATAVLKVLQPQLREPDPGVAACALATIGELAVVAGADVRPFVPELLPQLLPLLQDHASPHKRRTALRALSQLLRSTGCMAEPLPDSSPPPSALLLSTLLAMLGAEQEHGTRLELLRALGVLGAPDPSAEMQHQLARQHTASSLPVDVRVASDESRVTEPGVKLDTFGGGIGPGHQDFYPSIAIRALTRILCLPDPRSHNAFVKSHLRDGSLQGHHIMVIFALMAIMESLGLKCVQFLPSVMPLLLQTSRSGEYALREAALEQLGRFVAIIQLHARPHVPALLVLANEHLSIPGSIQLHCIELVVRLSLALNDEFRPYLPALMPKLLTITHADRTERRLPTLRVLHALHVLGQNLRDHLNLVAPAVIRLCCQPGTPAHVRRFAVRLLGQLCMQLDFREYASRLVHGMTHLLETTKVDERADVMSTLCALARSLGSEMLVFLPTLTAEMARLHVVHADFSALVERLQRDQPMGDFTLHVPQREHDTAGDLFDDDLKPAPQTQQLRPSPAADGSSGTDPHIDMEPAKLNQQSLRLAWEATQRYTRDDWQEWMRRLSVDMLRESPSPSLRACSVLAQVHQPLARELFNAAFLSCWNEVPAEGYQESVVASLETVLDAGNMSPEVLQQLLNLAEFMELADKPLPIDIRKLGTLAEKCHAFAKALHYREIEFHSYPAETMEALISINNQLQQPEAAKGILTYAWEYYQVELKESWYEKLQRWADARDAYERKEREDPLNLEWTLGRMRCQHALGEWRPLCEQARDTWRSNQLRNVGARAEVARLAAAAAWNLRLWDEMFHYTESMPPQAFETNFYRAILDVHSSSFRAAQVHIDLARQLLDSELTALVGESYNRAYKIMMQLQQLAELEEIIQHKENPADMPFEVLVGTWHGRLVQAQRDAEVWQEVLSVRYLVAPPAQDPHTWLKFGSLCRKSGRTALSYNIIIQILGTDPAHVPSQDLPSLQPLVAYAYIKQLWEQGSRQEALTRMAVFVEEPSIAQDARLAAKGWLKLGQWQRAILEMQAADPRQISRILQNLRRATDLNPSSYKAWHAWAMINYEALVSNEAKKYVVPAVSGFFRSIALGRQRALQDTLRLLSLWFKYGAAQEVDDAVQMGIDAIPIDTWLSVTPQIIARIHSPTNLVRRSVHLLLNRVAKEHPQGLIYPLTVASKSQSQPRQSAALRVLTEMRKQCDQLVEQAALVSVELIRTSVLLHEMWRAALEEASRLYFTLDDADGMLATLQPLHALLLRGPETMREASFQQAFGQELYQANEHCKRYKQTLVRTELLAAWDIYYSVFRRISKQMSKVTTLELQHVSPKLLEANDLELAVPGTYQADAPVVRIQAFAKVMSVIASKQRPRKLIIHGSDGTEHAFLLKGHEDLRQDERVMQLFGLVNTLLSTDRGTSSKDLAIQRYSVVPLSPNSGLISWVAQCDTLHTLIKEFRDARKILLNIEHRLMMQMAPDYELLPLLNQLEVFTYSLENTAGQDLARVLWLRSRSAEHWLLRRTNYTRSLAVMSLVGYVLGLGDRHPSNLMLDRLTGKILHIDFGDCFEVAVHREKFPETIPFRLTRMLVNAMEVSGIEGNFRSTCESAMGVLRNNKDSVMAMLEAFVYDPLINWRLLVKPQEDDSGSRSHRSRSMSIDASGSQRVQMRQRSVSTDATRQGVSTMLDDSGARGVSRAEADVHPASSIGTPHYGGLPIDLQLGASVFSLSRRGRTEPLHADERALNERGFAVLQRVKSKLAGSDFPDPVMPGRLDVATQVNRLIKEAQSNMNLCQLYVGW